MINGDIKVRHIAISGRFARGTEKSGFDLSAAGMSVPSFGRRQQFGSQELRCRGVQARNKGVIKVL